LTNCTTFPFREFEVFRGILENAPKVLGRQGRLKGKARVLKGPCDAKRGVNSVTSNF
jgi:hypothetical protein